jgi:radical SAM protein with 4Fe4S-binding SPASM domain
MKILEELDLQVTLRCNLKCDFCSVDANHWANEDLPLESILTLIKQAHQLGMTELHLTGGEPALRDDLETIIHNASRLWVITRVITNGTLLNSDRLRALRNAGLNNIMVSIDGDEVNHDSMRGVSGSYEKAMATVENALAIGFGTRISAVAFQHNQASIFRLLTKAAELGVHTFSIFLGSPLGRGREIAEQVIRPKAWREFLHTLGSRVQSGEYGSSMNILAEQGSCWPDDIGYARSNLEGRGAGCTTLLDSFDYLLVRGDGELFQCVFFMHEGESLGNIRAEPLDEILRRAAQQKQYADFTKPAKGCSSCIRLESCMGGCRGYAKLIENTWHAPDPRCENGTRGFFPVCPIAKLNLRNGLVGGSTEHALTIGDTE